MRRVYASDRPSKALSFSHSGTLLAVARDGPQAQSSGNAGAMNCRIARLPSEISIYRRRFPDDMIESLCMSLHPRLGGESPMQVLDGSAELLRKIWSMSGVDVLEHTVTCQGHEGRINSLAWSWNDAKIATGGEDALVIVWSCEEGVEGDIVLSQAMMLTDHSASVTCVAFSSSGSCLASASWDLTIRLWDPELGSLIGVLTGSEDFVTDLAFSSDGLTLVSASRDDKCLRMWGVKNGEERRMVQFQGLPKGSGRSVAFSQDGSLMAVGCTDWMVRVYDAKTGLPPKWGGVLSSHWGVVTCVAFTPDGSCLASASDDGTVRLWDVAFGQQIGGAMKHCSCVGSLAMFGNHLVTASGDSWTVQNELCVWQVDREGVGRVKREHYALDAPLVTVPRLVSGRHPGGWSEARKEEDFLEFMSTGEVAEEEKQQMRVRDDVIAYMAWLHRSQGVALPLEMMPLPEEGVMGEPHNVH